MYPDRCSEPLRNIQVQTVGFNLAGQNVQFSVHVPEDSGSMLHESIGPVCSDGVRHHNLNPPPPRKGGAAWFSALALCSVE